MEQILAHLFGDYVFQINWMANEKTKRWFPAIVHGIVYSLFFLFLTNDWKCIVIIGFTHIIIDHFRLVHYIGKLKNWNWSSYDGFADETPDWIRVWVSIIVDNSFHLLINYSVLKIL